MKTTRFLALEAGLLLGLLHTLSLAQDQPASARPETAADPAFDQPWSLEQARRQAGSSVVAALLPATQPSLGSTTAKIPIASGEEGDLPRSLAVAPDGSTLLVACRDTGLHRVLRPPKRAAPGQCRGGPEPRARGHHPG